MRLLMVAAIAGLVACSDPDLVAPTTFERSLPVVRCWSKGATDPIYWQVVSTPCMVFGSPHVTRYLDSSRIAFDQNGSVTWMTANHEYRCPCYLGGCSDPCYTTSPSVSQVTGTYEVLGNTIVARFNQAFTLYGTIPARVPRDWSGPDSLEYPQGIQSLSLIYTTP